MRVFVPIEDDLIPEGAAGLLVPYRCGLDCWHALGEGGSVLRVEVDEKDVQRCKISSSPEVTPSLAA